MNIVTTSQGSIAVWDTKPEVDNLPTVLFLHGHCTNKEFFYQQMKSHLFSDYRLIAIDLPGYGESSPPIDPNMEWSSSCHPECRTCCIYGTS